MSVYYIITEDFVHSKQGSRHGSRVRLYILPEEARIGMKRKVIE